MLDCYKLYFNSIYYIKLKSNRKNYFVEIIIRKQYALVFMLNKSHLIYSTVIKPKQCINQKSTPLKYVFVSVIEYENKKLSLKCLIIILTYSFTYLTTELNTSLLI